MYTRLFSREALISPRHLQEQRRDRREALIASGFEIADICREDDWVAFVARKTDYGVWTNCYFIRWSNFLLSDCFDYCLTVHEFSHAYFANKFGDPTAKLGRVTLNPAVHFDFLGIILLLIAGFGWHGRYRSIGELQQPAPNEHYCGGGGSAE